MFLLLRWAKSVQNSFQKVFWKNTVASQKMHEENLTSELEDTLTKAVPNWSYVFASFL